ncbi:MAG: N-acetylmuramic acid 6-phosphate etherase [Phycisphaerales bacterium]|nr:N-acetylmuramic acid 6-phosphate etherase [Phycisphaerales bacterium]
MTVPDRGHILTEQRNPRTMSLDRMSIEECLAAINAEDALVAPAVARALPRIADFVRLADRALRAGGRLIYIGAGTSGRLGVLDASELPPTFQTDPDMVVGLIAGGDAALRRSSEGMEDDPRGAAPEFDRLNVGAHDAVLGVAAGGTTPYVLGALDLAKSRGASTGLLTCSPVPRPASADVLILIETGPEAVTGSTRLKAGSATKMALNAISTTLMVAQGKTYENLMVDLRATNAKLRDRAARIVAALTGLPRKEALDLLDAAGGAVKTAVVMHQRDLTRELAERAIHGAGGSLRGALEAGPDA